MTTATIEHTAVAVWEALQTAACQTVNVLFVVIVGFAAYLTKDPYLAPAGVLLELVYLSAVSFSKSGRAWVLRRPPAEDDLDLVLLGVTVAGIVVIFFFGFGKHLLNRRYPGLSHAEGWELGAIFWTMLFGVYYLVKLRWWRSLAIEKFLTLVVGTVGGWLLWGAWHSMSEPTLHLGYLFWVAVMFSALDLLQWRSYKREPREDKNEAGRSLSSFCWADLPMLLAFGILWLYLKKHSDAEDPRVFVSGVVSCQLLFSNTVFVVMEFAFLKPA